MTDLRHIHFEGVPTGGTRVRTAVVRKICPVESTGNGQHDAFVEWILSECGLDVPSYRSEPLHRRIPACLRALRVASSDEARALLLKKPEMLDVALDAMLIGVTEFFRDEPVFEFLIREVLPGMCRRGERLRILSAGCSNGQELYSMAMLIAELGRLDEFELMGIDCRNRAVEAAMAGRYDNRAKLAIRPRMQEKFLERDGAGFRVVKPLCEKIQWKATDLLQYNADAHWDLILFRNIAIYLTGDSSMKLWENLFNALRPGGILVTGKSERPPADLPFVRLCGCVYQKGIE